MNELRDLLERLYIRFDHRSWVSPDPLQYLYPYTDLLDREIAAVVASSLAYGKVEVIIRSVGRVLDVLGESPAAYLGEVTARELEETLCDFRHRFACGSDLAPILKAVSEIQSEHGGLGRRLESLCENSSLMEALDILVDAILTRSGVEDSHLLPRPSRCSACKRLMLLLRWMVRCDEVDPGGWEGIGAERLLVPLDTHMHKIGSALGFTSRSSGDLNTAREITAGFREICPTDPVRYDFCLTRFGIRGELELDHLLQKLKDGSALELDWIMPFG